MLVEAKLIGQEALCKGVYRMKFQGDFPPVKPGQFVNVLLPRPDLPLPRPFGIVSCTKEELTLCYRVAGKGTEYMTTLSAGDKLTLNVGLGNGFSPAPYRRIALVGGGIGVFPLHSVPLAHPDAVYRSYLGYRNADEAVLLDEFACFGSLSVSTDDGSLGEKGTSVQAFLDDVQNFKPDAVFACGPLPMFRALKAGLKERGITIPAYVSLEERMGCGIGACLVCVCETVHGRKRVCKDGPVFPIEEVTL